MGSMNSTEFGSFFLVAPLVFVAEDVVGTEGK